MRSKYSIIPTENKEVFFEGIPEGLSEVLSQSKVPELKRQITGMAGERWIKP